MRTINVCLQQELNRHLMFPNYFGQRPPSQKDTLYEVLLLRRLFFEFLSVNQRILRLY